MNKILLPRGFKPPNPIMDKPILLPTHRDRLIPTPRFIKYECSFCQKHGHMYGGYYCTLCNRWFHKECAEAPSEIIHPSHPQHHLTLTPGPVRLTCGLCGIVLWYGVYACFSCDDFALDLTCGRNPAIELPESHVHSRVIQKEGKKVMGPQCEECKDESVTYQTSFHVGCVHLPQEVTLLSHPKHPLMLVTRESLSDVSDKTCLLCGGWEKVLYHCPTCNYTLCPLCVKNPPPLTIENPKTHNHQLTLWPRQISFTCNVCGLQGDRSPYICFLCDFMIHRECFGLPHVININRHDHRISLTNLVGLANSKCGVCRKSVNQYFGGYTCTTCPNYVVHPQCAMKRGVSELIELEGTPEDPIIPPYTVVGDGLIQHFSHDKEHYLRLNRDDVDRDESSRCEACVLPVYSDPIYSCERCDFMLHETCANLPMKKRLSLGQSFYTLSVGNVHAFSCRTCRKISNGYRYQGVHAFYEGVSSNTLDVICGSFSEPFLFDGHPHSLYLKEYGLRDKCVACQGTKGGTTLGCDDCDDYEVHLGCANFPKRVKHRSDDHYLTLCYGEEEGGFGKYWCDICERKTDPRKWFYTCSECGVTLHIQCVLGDFSHLLPKRFTIHKNKESEAGFEVVPNNKSDRPFCDECNFRCRGPFFLKLCKLDIRYLRKPGPGYLCSEYCVDDFIDRKDYIILTQEEY